MDDKLSFPKTLKGTVACENLSTSSSIQDKIKGFSLFLLLVELPEIEHDLDHLAYNYNTLRVIMHITLICWIYFLFNVLHYTSEAINKNSLRTLLL
jgi:hypothetical protein